MRFDKLVLVTTLVALSAALSASKVFAQARAPQTFGTEPGQTPVLETGVGYTFIHANAPPGQCGCFSANGGYGSVAFNMPGGFGVVADLTAVHANNIAGTTQSVTVFNYLFGPRYSFRTLSKRFVPYAQILGGGSQELSSYTAIQNVSGAAFSVGGGVNTTLKPHFGWTIVEADWVHSYIPNAQNNLQNDIRVSTGLTFRLGPR
jgi:outer membrane immunogenic protein